MATATGPDTRIEEILGEDAADLLQHRCQTIPKEQLHLPGPDFVDRIWAGSDRSVSSDVDLTAILVSYNTEGLLGFQSR